MYGFFSFFISFLLFLYYLFSLFFFFLFTSYYTLFFFCYSARCIRRSPTVRHDHCRHRRRLGCIDPARRRGPRRFASLLAKKLFRNKFTRTMTLVAVICACTYISHVNNIHRCAITARRGLVYYYILYYYSESTTDRCDSVCVR